MAFTERRTWNGVIRGELQSLKRRLNALKNYNTKHPDRLFLSDAELIIVNSMLTNVVQVKLDQTTVR